VYWLSMKSLMCDALRVAEKATVCFRRVRKTRPEEVVGAIGCCFASCRQCQSLVVLQERFGVL